MGFARVRLVGLCTLDIPGYLPGYGQREQSGYPRVCIGTLLETPSEVVLPVYLIIFVGYGCRFTDYVLSMYPLFLSSYDIEYFRFGFVPFGFGSVSFRSLPFRSVPFGYFSGVGSGRVGSGRRTLYCSTNQTDSVRSSLMPYNTTQFSSVLLI